jgi:hypothetical protein
MIGSVHWLDQAFKGVRSKWLHGGGEKTCSNDGCSIKQTKWAALKVDSLDIATSGLMAAKAT